MQGMSLCSSDGNKIIEKIDKALETSRTNRKTNGRTGNPGRAGNLSGI